MFKHRCSKPVQKNDVYGDQMDIVFLVFENGGGKRFKRREKNTKKKYR